MNPIDCGCGTNYTPKDAYSVKMHERTRKHIDWLEKQPAETTPVPVEAETPDEPAAFDDLDDLLEDPKPAKPKRVAKAKPKPEPKAKPTAKAKAPKVSATGDAKECRVCHKTKPLEEYRKKASRPDGRDTICAACSKDWLVAHKAKKAASA